MINIELKLEKGLPPVMADASQIQQVLVNLIENGRYEMVQKGIAGVITLATEQIDEGICIRVCDTGAGIPEENIAKIFDPFFTTKPPGEGTGLGLSLSYGIMQEHGGRLNVRNRSEGGAEFMVWLPLSAEFSSGDSGKDCNQKIEQPHYFQQGKKILVVDDERAVCDLVANVLSKQGIEVEAAFSSETALRRVESEEFDLLLLDIRLPDGDGLELKERIIQRWPSYKDRILFMTGEAVEEKGTQLYPLSIDMKKIISKPFNIQAFQMEISEMLVNTSRNAKQPQQDLHCRNQKA
jgi:CheY-like chemotaxis protein